jgi:hypothetical protein
MSDWSPSTEVEMETNETRFLATRAVLALAEVKAATESFDRGEVNVMAAMSAIVVASAPFACLDRPRREAA